MAAALPLGKLTELATEAGQEILQVEVFIGCALPDGDDRFKEEVAAAETSCDQAGNLLGQILTLLHDHQVAAAIASARRKAA